MKTHYSLRPLFACMFVFLLIHQCAHAQGEMLRVRDPFFCKKKTGSDPLTFFVIGSPDFAYHILSGLNALSPASAAYYKQSEHGKLSYTAGWGVRRKLNERLSLQSGLFYSVKGVQTKAFETLAKHHGILDRAIRTANYQTTYLEIPLRLNVRLNERFYVFGGAAMNIFLFNKMNYRDAFNDVTVNSFVYNPDKPFAYNKEEAYKENGYHTLNPQLQLGLGTDLYILNRYNIQLEPILKLSLSDVNHGPLKERFFSAGLNLAIALN